MFIFVAKEAPKRVRVARKVSTVSSSSLVRLSGLAVVAAGVLLLISELLLLTVDFDSFHAEVAGGSWLAQSFGFLLGFVLLLGALIGLYVRQVEAAGVLGLVGFLVAFLGTALLIGGAWEEAFGTPTLAEIAPQAVSSEGPPKWLGFGFILSGVLFSLGWVLFGVSTLRARVYPRAAAILLILGAVLALMPLPLTTVLGVTVAWLGFNLFTEKGVRAERSARVS
jgi:hypothetical protein